MSETLTKTFVAKVRNLDEESLMILKDFCDLSAKVEHALFQDLYVKKKNLNDLKRNYQIKFGINARHFNPITDKLKGKAKKIKLKNKESNNIKSCERKKLNFLFTISRYSILLKLKSLKKSLPLNVLTNSISSVAPTEP